MKSIAKYICLTLAAVVLAAAYSSRTIENLTLTKVSLAAPFKGTLSSEKSETESPVVRVRTPAELVIEDVYIGSGDRIKNGDKIMTLYPAAVDRALTEADNADVRDFLSVIRENGYVLTAPESGRVSEVKIKTDGRASPDDILYKYIPTGAGTDPISEAYETIVPLSALTPTGREDTYTILFAIPLTGRGESGQYTAIRSEVRLIASDGVYAAVDMIIRDDRQVIIGSEKPVGHGEKVRAGSLA